MSRPSGGFKRSPGDDAGKAYHHGRLRDALLQAAIEVIEERGVAEVRLRDLARRIGVSHAAPANHFRDRTALLTALAIEGFELLAAAQAAVLEQRHDAPLQALSAIGVTYVEFAANHQAYFEVMFLPEVLGDPELLVVAARSFQQLMGAVRNLGGAGAVASEAGHSQGALGAWALAHGLATLHARGLLPAAASEDLPRMTMEIFAAMTRLLGSGASR